MSELVYFSLLNLSDNYHVNIELPNRLAQYVYKLSVNPPLSERQSFVFVEALESPIAGSGDNRNDRFDTKLVYD